MSQRELKEAFISNLNGTSLGEVALGSFLTPLCFINRGLVWILYYQAKGTVPLPFPWISHFVLDFCMIVAPLVLSCTMLSDILHLVILALALVSGAFQWYVYHAKGNPAAVHPQTVTSKNFLKSHVQSGRVPMVTVFRVLVNIKTAISILAVDFNVFPRRYAKTELYGTGVMDFGVGAYVFANALVSPEARGRTIVGSKMNHIAKQLMTVWPLLVLGLIRLASVKMTGYHEHVTEYGVHWNFFFTLAIVRVVASLLLALFPVGHSWIFAVLLGGLYQLSLETTGLKSFLLHNNDRTVDFVHANKEGLFSVPGYIAIYMAGVQVGLYLMKPRTLVRDYFRVIFNLLWGSGVLYGGLFLCQATVEPVSRRLANLSFCLWIVAQCTFFLACLALGDMALLMLQRKSHCYLVPSAWNPHEKDKDSVAEGKRRSMDRFCLYQAINRNQLLFFLIANVTTGLTNILVDTFSTSDYVSVSVLLAYMFINCGAVHILHLFKITVKFW
ncbi:unnamed protein product [Boreogadus saida]